MSYCDNNAPPPCTKLFTICLTLSASQVQIVNLSLFSVGILSIKMSDIELLKLFYCLEPFVHEIGYIITMVKDIFYCWDVRLPFWLAGRRRRCKWHCTCPPGSLVRRTRTCGWRLCSRLADTGLQRLFTLGVRGSFLTRTLLSLGSNWVFTPRTCWRREDYADQLETPMRGCWRNRSSLRRWKPMCADSWVNVFTVRVFYTLYV